VDKQSPLGNGFLLSELGRCIYRIFWLVFIPGVLVGFYTGCRH